MVAVFITLLKIISILVLVIFFGGSLYTLPAVISLPGGRRDGIPLLSISQAVEDLRETGGSGWDLVEAARALVEERMQYCRRNSFNHASRAFERGYGYCQQQAHALTAVLVRLGFDAKVVHAFRNRFPDGSVGGHAWVRVNMDSQARQVDSIHYDVERCAIDFTPLTKVWEYTPVFRLFAGWGCAVVNAHRYYRTGVDE